MKKLSYKMTFVACCSCSVIQAITINLPPLLYIVFTDSMGIGLAQLSLLISMNFFIQIFVDLVAPLYVNRIGYRGCVLIAEALSILGLVSLAVLPNIMSAKYAGLIISTVLCAIGGGIIEVISGPIVETIPNETKTRYLSLLHSFYCWGHASVILLSTLLIAIIGLDNWYYLPIIWTLIPVASIVLFIFVPIGKLADDEAKTPIRRLISQKAFWLFIVLMICAGATEQGMAQWASLFVQKGLGISKTVGDILGPCSFAIFMGVGRVLLSLFGKRIRIERWLLASFALSAVCYLVAGISNNPIIALLGAAMCGIGTAILWPGTLTFGEDTLRYNGTAMFAYFALAGDIGCTLGPDLVGIVSDAVISGELSPALDFLAGDATSVGMRLGMMLATVFPLIASLVLIGFIISKHKKLKR